MLATGTDAHGGAVLAERVREAITAVRCPSPGGTVRLTATVGVGRPATGSPPRDLLEAADPTMYGDKGLRPQVV